MKISLYTLFFFRWRYGPLWALACRTIPLHLSLSITNSVHLLTPNTWRSLSTSSVYNMLCTFHVARVISVYLVLFHPSSLNLSSLFLCSTLVTINFLLFGVVSPMPNPQPGGPGYPYLSGSSPLTCLAWEALPVAYTTTSIALRIMWPHKPHHYVKVGTPSGAFISVTVLYFLESCVLPLWNTCFLLLHKYLAITTHPGWYHIADLPLVMHWHSFTIVSGTVMFYTSSIICAFTASWIISICLTYEAL